MRVNDAITGAVLVVFALAEIIYTRTFPSLHGQSYGPNLFPALIGIGLAACGIVLIFRGLLVKRAGVIDGDNQAGVQWIDLSNITGSKHARINAALIILFLLLYVLISDWTGFIPLSFVTLSILLYRLGSSIVMACIIAIIATAVIQFLFARVLLVPLPAGLLQGIVW